MMSAKWTFHPKIQLSLNTHPFSASIKQKKRKPTLEADNIIVSSVVNAIHLNSKQCQAAWWSAIFFFNWAKAAFFFFFMINILQLRS